MQGIKHQQGFGALVVVIVVAVLALAGAGVWFSMRKAPEAAITPTDTSMSASGSIGVSNTPAMSGSSGTAGASGTMKVSADTSDTSLDQNSQDVSTKLNVLNSDSVSVDQALNDKQGNLSEQ